MKQNANPTIYTVKKKECVSDKDLVGTQSLRRFQLGHNILATAELPSSEERSVYLALSSLSAKNTSDTVKDGSLDIVHQATGMSFPDPISHKSLSHCFFQPSSSVFVSSDETPFENKEKMENEGSSEMMATRRRIRHRHRHRDAVEAWEVFDIIRNIQDPEHPHTLEELNVVNLEHVIVVDCCDNYDNDDNIEKQVEDREEKRRSFPHVDVRFTPTIPHCSMAMLIGLCIRVKLWRSLPSRFKVTVRITPGTHASEHAVNKQLADKERVRAAIENVHLVGVVNRCIGNGMLGDDGDRG